MKLYYEAQEILPENSTLQAEFIRTDVTDMTDFEQSAVLKTMRDVMSGINCTFQKHTCYHNGGGNHPDCVWEDLR